MIDERPIGAALSRDIGTGEKVEAELDAFISRRDKQRRQTEGEHLAEGAWRESERHVRAHRDEEMRAAWCEYHQGHAARLRAVFESLIARDMK